MHVHYRCNNYYSNGNYSWLRVLTLIVLYYFSSIKKLLSVVGVAMIQIFRALLFFSFLHSVFV